MIYISKKVLLEQIRKKKYPIRDVPNTESYSRIFWSMISELNSTSDPFNKRKLIESIYTVLQKWSDKPPKYISKTVADLFLENKPNVDPFQQMHPERYILGKSPTKGSLLVWEHTTPLSFFIKDLIKSKNLDEVQEKLTKYTGICWITRDEDRCLYQKKFHSIRPEGWLTAYKSCGIEPMTKESYLDYKNTYNSNNSSTDL